LSFSPACHRSLSFGVSYDVEECNRLIVAKFAFVGTACVMHQQVCCVQLSMSVDNMALPTRLLLRAVLWRGCCNRPIFPARRAHSSKPAAAAGE